MKRHAPDPESWSPERVQRLRVLDLVNGDVDTARTVWRDHTRAEFLVYLTTHGALSEWRHLDDGGRTSEAP